ncbi:hypothetical protein ACLOJK_020269 [Asimina triloba]
MSDKGFIHFSADAAKLGSQASQAGPTAKTVDVEEKGAGLTLDHELLSLFYTLNFTYPTHIHALSFFLSLSLSSISSSIKTLYPSLKLPLIMDVTMSNSPHTKDFFATPALSLSLAGVFRRAAAAASDVEEGDEQSGGGGGSREEVNEVSSENTGPVGRSDDEREGDPLLEEEEEEEEGDDGKGNKKKRKKYHRHTAEQIREMEALFKDSPHPDEKQRQHLSKQLGLAPRQVKFWFQNRRTQIKVSLPTRLASYLPVAHARLCWTVVIEQHHANVTRGPDGIEAGRYSRYSRYSFGAPEKTVSAIQERHENSLLKSEIDKLREENQRMRENLRKACCPNCGFTTSGKDSTITTEEQQLRIEVARLKAEVEKLRATAAGKFPGGRSSSPSSSCSPGNDQENRSSLDYYTGFFGVEKSRILEIVRHATDELTKMATTGEPLWVRSVETSREILNYDEYVREFSPADSTTGRSIEASRETGIVFLDVNRLVQAFMDVNQWKEMFSCLISKAATVDVIRNGEGDNRNGAVQLKTADHHFMVFDQMFAEFQMMTPVVPTREVYFIRQCKQLSPDSWAIVDVSIDKLEENIDASLGKCQKRPSGCIIQDKLNGHCKVIWVEHLECQKSTVHTLYRSIVSSGLAFGAKHWMATLRLQCERLVFFMATNVPTKDSTGVATLAGRKSILRLAQRMTCSFCRAIGASSYHTWTKLAARNGGDMRVSSRKNLNDPGEPLGVILCTVSSIWLPIAPQTLFDFLRDDTRRNEVGVIPFMLRKILLLISTTLTYLPGLFQWDIMTTGGPTQAIANLAKGQDRGNSVSLHATQSKESSMWILQDSCTNAFESMVVYAPVDVVGMQAVMTGCDSSNVALLPSGFSILADGLETRPLVISSRHEERAMEGGSLLTIAFQILANSSPAAKLTMESVETVNTLISSALQNIKSSLKCEDG